MGFSPDHVQGPTAAVPVTLLRMLPPPQAAATQQEDTLGQGLSPTAQIGPRGEPGATHTATEPVGGQPGPGPPPCSGDPTGARVLPGGVMDEGGCLRRAGARPAPRMCLHTTTFALQAGPGCDCLGLS